MRDRVLLCARIMRARGRMQCVRARVSDRKPPSYMECTTTFLDLPTRVIYNPVVALQWRVKLTPDLGSPRQRIPGEMVITYLSRYPKMTNGLT